MIPPAYGIIRFTGSRRVCPGRADRSMIMKKIDIRKIAVILSILLIVGIAGAVLTLQRDAILSGFSGRGGADGEIAVFDYGAVPAWSGEPYVTLNGDVPYFTEDELSDDTPFEEYGELDALGRCTGAFACIDMSLVPDSPRESIRDVKPSGWQFDKYEGIDGHYLYNRCHLIAHALTGENANERNLITGTRYLNTVGMNEFETRVLYYLYRTECPVLYRVTPVFEGNDLVCRGVLMEGKSLLDDEIEFCAFVYNVQPGITIDYATGKSEGTPYTGEEPGTEVRTRGIPGNDGGSSSGEEFVPPAEDVTFVVNKNTGKFHRPDCDSVKEMKQKNRWDFTGSREELIEEGYSPCGACRP